jgi:hypothetical protein
MNRMNKICGLLLPAALFVMSGAAFGACSFSTTVPSGYSAPDAASDLSGQGNISCANITGKNGLPMVQAAGVVFKKNGDWELPQSAWVTSNGFVTNTPDKVLEFPQGNGSRCAFDYYTVNAVKGTGLNNGGNVDTHDSFACTDNVVNVKEVSLPPPDIITTTGNDCDVTLNALNSKGETVDESDFDWFVGGTLTNESLAICNQSNKVQYECQDACPGFKDIEQLQDLGYCQSDSAGYIPLTDSSIPSSVSPDTRCTPCLSSADVADDPSYNLEGKKFCWEYVNSLDKKPGYYRPHKPVGKQVIEINSYNKCSTVTGTINWFGTQKTTTYTVCN